MSSKVAKKRLLLCKEKAEKLGQLLNDKKGQADVTEFVNTSRFLVSVFDEYTKTKDKERPTIPDEGARIEQLLKEYEDLLNQLVSSGRFNRFFTSMRVRKSLDQLNSQLFKETIRIHNDMQAKRKTKKTLKPDDFDNYVETIGDADAKELWATNFGQTLMVGWQDFINVLQKAVQIDDETNKQLQYILDNANTGYVSIYKFADFLCGFGPLKQCAQKVQAIVNLDWFHGFLSSTEAERLLERQAAGTYLIRFSKSKPGSFAIAYVDGSQRNTVIHTLITSCPPSGFKIEEAYNKNARGRLFASLSEVVEFYGYILQIPFRSDLSRQSWFHGDLSSQEAEEILAGEKDGTFLFRFSSKAGYLAVSYLNSGSGTPRPVTSLTLVVKHGLLEALPGGYKFDNQPPLYPSLQDVVANLKELLKVPLTSLTFESSKKGGLDLSKVHQTIKGVNNVGVLSQGESNYASFSGVMKGTASPAITSSPTTPSAYVNITRNPGSPIVSNYASITAVNSTPSSSSEYTTISQVNKPATPSSPSVAQNPSGQQYGKMPNPISSPQQPHSPTMTPQPAPVHHPSPSHQQYGAMPIPAQNPGSNSAYVQISTVQSPQRPTPAPNPSTQQYGSMPMPGQNTASTNTASPYVQINSVPKPSPAPNPSVQQYGSMPVPGQNTSHSPAPQSPQLNPSGQQYGKMPTPGSPSTVSHTAPQPQAQPSASQYGSISAIKPMTVPSALNRPTPPAPATVQQYGSMPTPGTNGSPAPHPAPAHVPTPHASNPSSQQYGKMPTPGANSPYGGIQLPSANRTPTSPAPKPTATPGSPATTGQQYGSMPSPQASSTSNGRPMTVYKQPSSPSVSNGHSQYGSLPTPAKLSQRVPSTTSLEYGGLPTNDNYGGLPSTTDNYGGLPVPNEDNYGGLPRVSEDNYGGLPRTTEDNYGGLPNPESSDNYGGLPRSEDNYGGLPVDNYGGLPNPNDNYGGLPTSSSEYGGLPSTDNYGGLPSTQQLSTSPSSEYGGLPTTDNQKFKPGGFNMRQSRDNSVLSTHRTSISLK